jgi:hypothetical protein
MELLGLVRFSPSHGVMQPVRLACDRFESLLPQFQAEILHREELQMMFVLGDLNKGLALLRVALDSAALDGFIISGGLAQGIRSRATLASSLAGFTEGSMEMLFEIANSAGPLEIAPFHPNCPASSSLPHRSMPNNLGRSRIPRARAKCALLSS